MLFKGRIREGLERGTVTVAYRRWRRPTVRTGGTLRTPVGVLAIDDVRVVEEASIDADEARRAGYRDVEELLADLGPAAAGRVLYRIEFHHAGPDPRVARRDRSRLTQAELVDLVDRLDRLDRRAPWTRATLAAIDAEPGTPARDLARTLGVERERLKRDVRKLKELGLTESLDVGYRLSRHGRALRRALDG